MTVLVPLTRGYEAIIDDEDAERVFRFKWRAMIHQTRYKKRVCAIAGIPGPKPVKCILMHRLIMNAEPGVEIDHINHNAIDNRKSNLRRATRAENSANNRGHNPKSGYVGVFKSFNLYYGRATKDGKQYTTGGHPDPRDAAIARNHLAVRLFGQFASLNDVSDDFERMPPVRYIQPSGVSAKKNLFYGVGKRGHRYRAWITVNGNQVTVGSYSTDIEAAIAHDEKAIEVWGADAPLNFPYHWGFPEKLEERSAKSVTQISRTGVPAPEPDSYLPESLSTYQKPLTTSVPLSVTTAIGHMK